MKRLFRRLLIKMKLIKLKTYEDCCLDLHLYCIQNNVPILKLDNRQASTNIINDRLLKQLIHMYNSSRYFLKENKEILLVDNPYDIIQREKYARLNLHRKEI